MKISNEMASEGFKNWLDFRKVKKSRRETLIDQEDIIVEAIEDGDLIINDDNTLEYTLLDSLKSDDDEIMLEKLTFKARIRKEELNKKYKGLKATDADGRLIATVAALTGQNSNLIGKLYTTDSGLCEAIAVYFL